MEMGAKGAPPNLPRREGYGEMGAKGVPLVLRWFLVFVVVEVCDGA